MADEPKGKEIEIELHDEDPEVTEAWKLKGREHVTGRDDKGKEKD